MTSWISFISRILIVLVAFPLHEYGHAWTATALGDETPRTAGRLTLNPLKHVDPFGAIALLLFGFGWAKPVPVNQAKLREKGRWAPILAVAAGAMMNFLLMLIIFITLRLILASTTSFSTMMANLINVLVQFMMINLVLVVFNLLPIPPLDGYLILGNLLPPSAEKFMAGLNQYGIIILLVLFYILPQFGFDPLGNFLNAAMNLIWNALLM